MPDHILTRRVLPLAGLVAAALLLALLAGGPSADAKSTVRMSATESSSGLGFSKTSVRTAAGKVTLVMRSGGSLQFPHAIAIEGNGVEKAGKIVQPGGRSKVTVTLKRGRSYTFYCPVGEHRQNGMEGTLRVRR